MASYDTLLSVLRSQLRPCEFLLHCLSHSAFGNWTPRPQAWHGVSTSRRRCSVKPWAGFQPLHPLQDFTHTLPSHLGPKLLSQPAGKWTLAT